MARRRLAPLCWEMRFVSGRLSQADFWSLLIGARHVRPGRRRFSRADDRLLQRITAEHFPAGYTILEARGGWFDPDARRFIREESRQVLVASDSVRTVTRWAAALGAALRQHELLLIKVGRPRRIVIRNAK